MSKLPNLIVRTCSNCGKSNHKVKEIKKGKTSKTTDIERQKKRMGNRGNLGKWSKVPQKKVKTSKKPHLLITCTNCNRNSNLCRPRTVKLEVIKK